MANKPRGPRRVKLVFHGIDNKHDPETLGVIDRENPVLKWLTEAIDVDIDDAGGIDQREGYALAISGTQHSGWSRGSSAAYFVEGAVLKQLDPALSVVALLSLSTNDRMRFVDAGVAVVFTNGTDIGTIINGSASLLGAQTTEFKATMPAGQCIAFLNGCLYVAAGDKIYRSDAYDLEAMDERWSLTPLPGYISMLAAVDDGLWVSYGDETRFFKDGIIPESLVMEGPPGSAVYGTDVLTSGAFFEGLQASGDAVVWRASQGICIGGKGGVWENLSEDTYSPKLGVSGAAIVRHSKGQVHYIGLASGVTDAYNEHTT